MKKLAGIAFVIGFVLILGEAGTDDLMVLTHQEHIINVWKLIFGVLLCIPLPMVYTHGS